MTPQPPTPPQTVIDYAAPAQQRASPLKGLFGWVLFIGLAVMFFILLNRKPRASTEITLSEFRAHLMTGNVAEVALEDDALHGKFARTTPIRGAGALSFRVALPPGMGNNWSFVQWVLDNAQGANVRADPGKSVLMNLLLPLVPWALIFAFIWFFVFRQLRRSGGQPAPIPVYMVNPPAPSEQHQP